VRRVDGDRVELTQVGVDGVSARADADEAGDGVVDLRDPPVAIGKRVGPPGDACVTDLDGRHQVAEAVVPRVDIDLYDARRIGTGGGSNRQHAPGRCMPIAATSRSGRAIGQFGMMRPSTAMAAAVSRRNVVSNIRLRTWSRPAAVSVSAARRRPAKPTAPAKMSTPLRQS